MVKAIQTARVHGLDATERVGVPGTRGAGAVAQARVTLMDQVTIAEQAARGVREPRRPRPSGDGDSVEPPSDDAND